jgi:hypothetical protein
MREEVNTVYRRSVMAPDPYRALAAAVVLEAIKQARKKDRGAKAWLLDEGYDWLECLGFLISIEAWERFVKNGCKYYWIGRRIDLFEN